MNNENQYPKKIISGGQTGADQAALDVAIKLNIPHGGWIPKGRKTEAGLLPEKYQLQEMTSVSYPLRTEKNVIDHDRKFKSCRIRKSPVGLHSNP
jgi:hypothetical protein